jgi:hypothetical protein
MPAEPTDGGSRAAATPSGPPWCPRIKRVKIADLRVEIASSTLPGHRAAALTSSVIAFGGSGADARTPAGLLLAGGAAVMVGAVAVAAMVPHQYAGARVALVALALAGLAAVTGEWRTVTATVVLAAFMVNGFLVNIMGDLSWHGLPDLWRIGTLAGAAVAGLTAHVIRARLRRPARPVVVRPAVVWSTLAVARADYQVPLIHDVVDDVPRSSSLEEAEHGA